MKPTRLHSTPKKLSHRPLSPRRPSAPAMSQTVSVTANQPSKQVSSSRLSGANKVWRLVRRYNFGFGLAVGAVVILAAALLVVRLPKAQVLNKYDISRLDGNLVKLPVLSYASKLVQDSKTKQWNFNQDYRPGTGVDGDSSAPKFGATFSSSKSAKVSFTDPVNQVTPPRDH